LYRGLKFLALIRRKGQSGIPELCEQARVPEYSIPVRYEYNYNEELRSSLW